MKIVSKITLWLGIIILVVGLGVGIWGSVISLQQYLALDALKSAPTDNPIIQLSLAAVALALGGFLAGLGLGTRPKDVTPKPTA